MFLQYGIVLLFPDRIAAIWRIFHKEGPQMEGSTVAGVTIGAACLTTATVLLPTLGTTSLAPLAAAALLHPHIPT